MLPSGTVESYELPVIIFIDKPKIVQTACDDLFTNVEVPSHPSDKLL
jgi:hypothetical protein